MRKWTSLFFTFLKIGAFTFGGGYAMIALLEHEFVSKKHWVDQDEFLDMAAIAESTPGPIAVNSATYLGYKLAGFPGSLLATTAVCLPSFVILYLISMFFDQFLDLSVVSRAFQGIQVCVIYLIFSAACSMLKHLEKTRFNLVILTAVACCMIGCSIFSVSFSSVFYVLICGIIGILFFSFQRSASRNSDQTRNGGTDV